ncbi:hypothetical protein [Saccharibacillus sp. JS10]|uniref:hypothetical protein n=1 Tax=Saccharibacillus sp. JS10 TaxID=2950552 RepID=UPI00210BD75A|nr:hypothetical protein [Saccharibacillus sp. JS10]MCQ4086993.1 hypothetical protein [Saccharibacillus sp. JS10]
MSIDFVRDFQRVLRLKDIEVWDVHVADKDYRIAIVDEHRPSTDLDFPWLKDGLGEDKRNNHITIHLFFLEDMDEAEKRTLYHIAEQFTGHLALAHCNVTVLFEKVKDYRAALDEVLRSKGHPNYDEFKLDKFFYFSQD